MALSLPVIRWFEHRQVYAPTTKLEAKASDLRRPWEEFFFSSSDGLRLHGWWFPANAGGPRSRLALLHLHGNAGNISHRLHYYEAWLELGVNVCAFDYRGFGRSEGIPGEAGTYADAQAAVGWLRRKGFPPGQVVALGKSLGGGVASELALREPLAGLILQNTFTSIPDVGAELFPWLPVRRWHSIRYATLEKLPRIKAPVLIAHSRADKLIGFHHGERNFRAANQPKLFLEIGGGHNTVIEEARADYVQGLDQFFRVHLDHTR